MMSLKQTNTHACKGINWLSFELMSEKKKRGNKEGETSWWRNDWTVDGLLWLSEVFVERCHLQFFETSLFYLGFAIKQPQGRVYLACKQTYISIFLSFFYFAFENSLTSVSKKILPFFKCKSWNNNDNCKNFNFALGVKKKRATW
jgi:hypothetical protein